MIEIFKNLFLYDALPLLLCAVLIGLLATTRDPRAPKWGRRLILIAIAAVWLAGIRPGASLIVKLVAWNLGPATIDDVRGVGAIVVLDGGTKRIAAGGRSISMVADRTALRALETVRVSEMIGVPLVIVSAQGYGPETTSLAEAETLREAIMRLGIPEARVVVDSGSRNTREHAVNLKAILDARNITRFVLVTSPTHLRRALAAFHSVGLSPIPSAAQGWPDGGRPIYLDYWWPSNSWLSVSQGAVYDVIGITYYWIRGWLS